MYDCLSLKIDAFGLLAIPTLNLASYQVDSLSSYEQNVKAIAILMWAKRFAFSIVSSRASFRGRLNAIWSSEPVKLTQQRVISNPVGCVDNDIARIASLAVY